MKPKNFPGRKNDRRRMALARMKRPPADLSHAEKSEHPFYITQARIVPDHIARSIRTKKDRSARGKLRS